MDKLISYCGFNCKRCPIYKATKENNKKKLKKLKINLQKEVNEKLSIEEIKCNGCKSDKVYRFCSRCKIRTCAIKKGVECCAYCDYKNCSLIEKIKKYNKNIFSDLNKIKKSSEK
ncbi:MAG TPA: DUF3795 domain-containing protein [Candidatus Mcinerneyibacterium sp.]|nr:DUF3795 domain-containing protein [Candidatus Mcinerneyibacterium sp.]